MTTRQEKVQELLKKEISDILRREFKDPRLGFITVIDTEVTPDLRHAKVWVSVMGSDEERVANMKVLKNAEHFVRLAFGKRVKMKTLPGSNSCWIRRSIRACGFSSFYNGSRRMNTKKSLREAWRRLLDGQSYVIACHVRPDGDALGSALALAHALRRFGKDVVVVSEDVVPENYAFIPESESIVTSTQRRDFDFGVLVDSEAPKRVGSAAEAVTSAAKNSMHRSSCSQRSLRGCAGVDTQASATAIVIYEMLKANEVELD